MTIHPLMYFNIITAEMESFSRNMIWSISSCIYCAGCLKHFMFFIWRFLKNLESRGSACVQESGANIPFTKRQHCTTVTENRWTNITFYTFSIHKLKSSSSTNELNILRICSSARKNFESKKEVFFLWIYYNEATHNY